MEPQTPGYRIATPPEPVGWVILQPAPFKTQWGISVWPNWWRRFWYWALLGWTFEKNDGAV